jgi:hypothetical protein
VAFFLTITASSAPVALHDAFRNGSILNLCLERRVPDANMDGRDVDMVTKTMFLDVTMALQDRRGKRNLR